MSGGEPIPFGRALRFWLELGFISFGGPAARSSSARAVIAVVATAALFSRRVEVIPVIAASGLAGLALWALGYPAT